MGLVLGARGEGPGAGGWGLGARDRDCTGDCVLGAEGCVLGTVALCGHGLVPGSCVLGAGDWELGAVDRGLGTACWRLRTRD